jgi:DNA/RNA endonuclease G (NUC1)
MLIHSKHTHTHTSCAIMPCNSHVTFTLTLSYVCAFIADGKQSATIICTSGNKFNINNQQHSASEFNECSSAITGNVVNRNRYCGTNGTSLTIGFQLIDGKGFVDLIDVCYSKKRGSAIYTAHVIQGVTIKSAMKASQRPSSFKTTEVPSNIAAATSFTKASQQKRFTEIFGSAEKAEEYLNKTYLARGHLAPDGDMIFVSWQWSTYYYINVVPQWQSINNGNWKHVESAVRSKAASLKNNVVVFTGAFDVLKIGNKKISLEPDGLDVPKWSWKVAIDASSGKGIAFVTYNNPFAASVSDLCDDICDSSGWHWKERKNFSKGYTLCCEVNQLMGVVSEIPPEARVSGVLEK